MGGQAGEAESMADQSDERTRIMDAAYQVLSANAGASASVAGILAAAGLSTRAFYRHFGSKDDLLLAMFRRDNDRVNAEMRAAVTAAASPADALGAFVHGTLRLTSERRRRARVLVMTSEEARRARGYDTERSRSALGQQTAIAAILERGRADGSFPWVSDPDADARAIVAALRSAFDEQIARTATVTAAQAADQVVDFALRALGAREPAAA
jgi:AcrR family transcriptional regulator